MFCGSGIVAVNSGRNCLICNDSCKETIELLDYGFNNYKLKTIVNLNKAPTINLLNNFNTQNILYETSCAKDKNIVIILPDAIINYLSEI